MEPTKSTSEKTDKWTRSLLILVSGFLLFELISGLWIYLTPFSVSSQVIILIHTSIGILFSIPYLIYQFQHWREYRNRTLDEVKLTGYVSMVAAIVATISGWVLTWEALFELRITYLWEKIHIHSTFVLLFSVIPHVLLIVIRDYRSRHHSAIKVRLNEQKKYGANLFFTFLALFFLFLLSMYSYEKENTSSSLPSDYQYLEGNEELPFAPSQAITEHGGSINPKLLGRSESCSSSGCHVQIGEEWEVSAHRYSAMDPAFRAVQNVMGNEKGAMSTRYCGGCHDPISLFSGTKNLFKDSLTNKAGLHEGISCLSCHSIKKVDVMGNADFVIDPPDRYLFELTDTKIAKKISDFLIRAYPEKHKESLQQPLYKTTEFCGSCHKQFIDEKLNNVGWVQLQNQYDNWRKSHWNTPMDPLKTIECRECHMPLVDSFDPSSGDGMDYNRSETDGKHRSHRFLGSNQMIPLMLNLPGAEEHVELTKKWLRGEFEIPEIEHKWTNGPAIPIKIRALDQVTAGEDLIVNVTITNNKGGHNFPTGPLDIIQAWIEIQITDDKGQKVYTSGTLDKDHFIEPGAFIFKAEPVDQYNNVIDRHNLWDMVGVRYSRALYPKHSDNAYFEVQVPQGLGKQKELPVKIPSDAFEGYDDLRVLNVSAKLQYRKINQYMINWMFPDNEAYATAPVTTLASDQKSIKVIPKRTIKRHLQ